ncbi:DUF3088 family protein [Caulobacter vibrioides]|uniref:DUF3088 family protein n=1 Tax=Caulobacter vibrioides TaxID=155892 RepID=UPI001E37C1B9|nr:DUF3088 family protein [Caulobacter vibrioides]
MAKDTLYLLKPHFEKDGAQRFCPDCAMMEGYLATYPALREALEIVYVDYARPRAVLVERLGKRTRTPQRLSWPRPLRTRVRTARSTSRTICHSD